jgi:hypothetical protein
MPSTFRNIIIFLGIAMILTSVYIVYVKKPDTKKNLVSSSSTVTNLNILNTQTVNINKGQQDAIAQNFLSLLLNIKNINLDQGISIFSDKAFNSLHDSTVKLNADHSEGRPNPFAKFGADSVETSGVNTATIPTAPLNTSLKVQ